MSLCSLQRASLSLSLCDDLISFDTARTLLWDVILCCCHVLHEWERRRKKILLNVHAYSLRNKISYSYVDSRLCAQHWLLWAFHPAPRLTLTQCFFLLIFGPASAVIRCIKLMFELELKVIVGLFFSGCEKCNFYRWKLIKKICEDSTDPGKCRLLPLHSAHTAHPSPFSLCPSYCHIAKKRNRNPFTIGAKEFARFFGRFFRFLSFFSLLRLRLNWSTLSLIQWHARREREAHTVCGKKHRKDIRSNSIKHTERKEQFQLCSDP